MTVRFGAGAYFGMGVVTPYGTTGTNASIDFLIRAQEGTDALTYKRTLLDPKDLSSYDTQYDQVQAGEESVEGSVSDKCTYKGMQDLLRMFNGSNPTVSGASPYVYTFSGSSKPTKFSDPNHHQAGTTTRNWCIEMYKGSIVRSTTETNANTGNLTVAIGPPVQITRAVGVWSTTAYPAGAIVTIAGSTGIATGANGIYVVASGAGSDTLSLRQAGALALVTDVIATGTLTAATVSSSYQESTFYQGCNIKSMKLNFARNDYVQRSMDFMGTTANTGASSHSYRQGLTLRESTHADFATASFSGSTIIANAGADPWTSRGYVVGGEIVVAEATTSANNGTYRIASFGGTTGRTMTVTTLLGAAVSFTGESWGALTYFTTSAMTNLAQTFGAGAANAGTGIGLWLNDYAVSNPGQGATKFLILGGTAFICREAELTIEEPLEFRYDIGQSTSELPLPEQKRSVKINCTLETSDEKFIEILRSPSTKAFGASGGDYTGANTLQILGAAGSTTAGYSLVFSFPRLVIEGDSETRVEGIGPTTAQFELTAMSTDVNDPAYTVVVTNGDSGYRT